VHHVGVHTVGTGQFLELQGTERTDAALVDTAPTQTLTAAAAAAAATCSACPMHPWELQGTESTDAA
jgi:hypothetical protein